MKYVLKLQKCLKLSVFLFTQEAFFFLASVQQNSTLEEYHTEILLNWGFCRYFACSITSIVQK